MKRSVFFGLGTALLSTGLAICGFVAGERFATQETESNHSLPVYATASSESDGVIVATGGYSGNVEAMYYLDSQSCRLSAGLISRTAPALQKSFTRNLKNDLADAAEQLKVSVPVSPKFLMVTGEADIRNVGAVANMSRSLVYVAEINSGIVFVYALPGVNDRDLVVSNGEIILWTFARLNDGLQASGGTNFTQPVTGPESQLIDSGFYRTQ
ncbi:MAG: hypothetical protein ACOX0A_04225 [Thermoguttaceae bacterium]|jgi:hypothetical protein